MRNYILILILVVVGLAISFYFLIPRNKGEFPGKLCGNGICEYFETSEECCIDCGCLGNLEVCNRKANKCEVQIPKISDSEAKRLIQMYYENKFLRGEIDFELKEITQLEDFAFDSEVIKSMRLPPEKAINFEGKSGKRALVLGIHHPKQGEPFLDYGTAFVTDDGNVTHIEHA
jgi:hypothetical protein